MSLTRNVTVALQAAAGKQPVGEQAAEIRPRVFIVEAAVGDAVALLDELPARRVRQVGISLNARHRPGSAAPPTRPGARAGVVRRWRR